MFKNLHSAKFYYLHSYFFQCSNNNHILAKTKYGLDFTSAFHKGNLYGVQFHPEKSHGYGSLLLENIIEDMYQLKMISMKLNTQEDNYIAQKLYENKGFSLSTRDLSIMST